MPPKKPAPRVSETERRRSKPVVGTVSGKKPAQPGATLGPVLTGHVDTAPAPVDDETLIAIFARLREADPEPRSELQYLNPYTLLVAVVLSAQATDKSVNLATEPLFAIADTPQKMLDLGEERVRHFIRTIGLFNTKAKNVIALSRILLERHGGEVPREAADLEVLPGVGTKTASVVLNVAFGVPRIAVDTHIFRVSNRIPLFSAPTTDKVQAGLEARVPEPYRLNAHHWLILHGRYTCKARRPDCPRCRIADLCRYPSKTTELTPISA
ncbi:endonuclease III [Methylorubrum suomiense]|uniref:Endonuclease III n=1 Tax=Methylorubrum suomiense TaxID=144191 RepID=A0ABQ4V7J2_9HYPH|nr:MULTISPECIES: endonuclease III [Methylobacteriaceae]GJE78382.1 Endonuclease III [Methylorubrum suomiense]